MKHLYKISDDIRDLFLENEVNGQWATAKTIMGHVIFKADTGGKLTFWPRTQTICLQGKSHEIDFLRPLVESLFGPGELESSTITWRNPKEKIYL